MEKNTQWAKKTCNYKSIQKDNTRRKGQISEGDGQKDTQRTEKTQKGQNWVRRTYKQVGWTKDPQRTEKTQKGQNWVRRTYRSKEGHFILFTGEQMVMSFRFFIEQFKTKTIIQS